MKTKREFTERMAAGFRNMGIKPDYLLIMPDKFIDFEFDETQFSGVPIIKSYISVNSGYDGHEYPVIPCFKDIEEKEISKQVYYFQTGFEDYFYN